MTSSSKYVCAFRGRRDYYQVPLALAEGEMLDEFITDAYSGRFVTAMSALLPQQLREKVRFRRESGVPDDRVSCLWGTTAVEQIRHRLGLPPWRTFAKLDRRYGWAAAARARRTQSHLILYNSYAWEAFTAHYRHTPRKVLFQYHPHFDMERRILREDSQRYPLSRHSFEEEAEENMNRDLAQRSRECWRYADMIVCASTFTRQSLVEAGADPKLCEIIPYGIDVPPACDMASVPVSFRVLFVGTGTQRKGLHHLLLAWERAVLPADSQLTLLCRFIDPGLEKLAMKIPRVQFLRGIGGRELQQLFGASSVMAMPSLVEGFGQVYLESLAQGCPVLGTPNTCLPDLGDSSSGIYLTEPGNIDQLVAQLETLSGELPGNEQIRRHARQCAAQWPWSKFRQGIRTALGSSAPTGFCGESLA